MNSEKMIKEFLIKKQQSEIENAYTLYKLLNPVTSFGRWYEEIVQESWKLYVSNKKV